MFKALLALAVAIVAVACVRKLGSTTTTTVPLETQLRTLATCGIRLLPERSIDELLMSWPREKYESEAYTLLVSRLGGEVEAEPWGRFFSDRAWHLDLETIEDRGDYARVIRRLAKISNVPLTAIKDHVDLESNQAWVEFDINGKHERWTAAVDDDWLDTSILRKFAELVRKQGSCLLGVLHEDGQTVTLAALTKSEVDCLQTKTPLRFRSL